MCLSPQKLELTQLALLGQNTRERGTEGRESRNLWRSPLESPADPHIARMRLEILEKEAVHSRAGTMCGVHTSGETSCTGHSVEASEGCCPNGKAKLALDYSLLRSTL